MCEQEVPGERMVTEVDHVGVGATDRNAGAVGHEDVLCGHRAVVCRRCIGTVGVGQNGDLSSGVKEVGGASVGVTHTEEGGASHSDAQCHQGTTWAFPAQAWWGGETLVGHLSKAFVVITKAFRGGLLAVMGA